MKTLFIAFFILFACSASAQKFVWYEGVTDHSLHIVGENFNGVIFSKAFHDDIPMLDTLDLKSRFTPEQDDILLSEKILSKQLKKVVQNSKYKGVNEIFKSLRSYVRQYVGFTNLKGQKVIFLNCIQPEGWGVFIGDDGKVLNIPPKPEWYYHFILKSRFGTSVWQVKINLETKEIYAFSLIEIP